MGNESSKSKQSSSGASQIASSLGIKSGPSNATVQRQLDTAKKTRVLQLKELGLKKIPDQLVELAEFLRHLELSSNKLKSLPDFICTFSQLKQLHVSDNLLDILPEDIGGLKSLEVLNLHNNHLSGLPASIVACNSLKTLTLSSNDFDVIPLEVCNMLALETLNMANNRITGIPDEISSCKVVELNLNQNRLATLNADSLSSCAQLKILRVEENCLAKTEFSKELLENSAVALISYGGNLFQDKEFQDLNGYESYQERYTATRRKM